MSSFQTNPCYTKKYFSEKIPLLLLNNSAKKEIHSAECLKPKSFIVCEASWDLNINSTFYSPFLYVL